MTARRRIGLYGGSFDPVHLGHVEVAREVSKLFDIDLLLFIPAEVAPHKVGRKVTASVHRHTMLALATQDDPSLLVSTYELNGPDRRYTVDTLKHFLQVFSGDDIFFVMGADSWEEIHTWRDWEFLLSLTNHVVVTRPGYQIDVNRFGPDIVGRVVDLRNAEFGELGSEPRIFLTNVVQKDISATQIRSAAASGNLADLSELVPRRVAEYISKYRLYRNSNETEFYS